jgi:type VI secretion system protein ImpK
VADKDDEDDSGDKTVVGAPLPTPPPPGLSPARAAPVPPTSRTEPDASEKTVIGSMSQPESQSVRAPAPKPAGDGEKTMIGGVLPQVQMPPVEPHPERGQTIVGGSLPPMIPIVPAPAPKRAPVPPQSEPAPQSSQQGPEPPQAATPPRAHADFPPPVPWNTANMQNPFLAAAGNLLLLLGRLRTGTLDVSTPALYDHVLQAISGFETALEGSYADKHDTLVAKYALCGTVDDIVQNVPDVDQAYWRNQPMVSRFFSKRDSNVGFFQEAQKAIQSPSQRYNLLEFMLICLNIGFEGQYRGKPGGTADLASIRSAIQESLRRTRPAHDRPLSPNWTPVALQGRGGFRSIPIWALAGMAFLALVAFFGTLTTLLNRDGTALAERLYALHPAQTPITLERAPGPVFVAPASQFERLSDGLGGDLSAGRVELSQQGDFIVIRLSNARMFASGSSDVNPAFTPLAERLAAVLEVETGPLYVVGYTDSQGAFNANLQLSVERAEAVAELLRANLSDPLRVTVEGRGETDPIADNSTEEGRAKNRRVEIKLAREGTF